MKKQLQPATKARVITHIQFGVRCAEPNCCDGYVLICKDKDDARKTATDRGRQPVKIITHNDGETIVVPF